MGLSPWAGHEPWRADWEGLPSSQGANYWSDRPWSAGYGSKKGGSMLNFESAVMLGWRETTHIWGPVQCPFRSPRHFRAKEKVGPVITTGHKSQAGHGAKCSKDWAVELPEGFFQAFGRQQKLGKSKLGEDQNHHRRRSAGEKCCSLKDLGKLGPHNMEVS